MKTISEKAAELGVDPNCLRHALIAGELLGHAAKNDSLVQETRDPAFPATIGRLERAVEQLCVQRARSLPWPF